MHSWMRRQLDTMDEPTRRFVTDVYARIEAASQLPGPESITVFAKLFRSFERYAIEDLSDVPPDQVHLTFEHWHRFTDDARELGAFAPDGW